jgi:hypothetical protein
MPIEQATARQSKATVFFISNLERWIGFDSIGLVWTKGRGLALIIATPRRGRMNLR